MLAIMPWNFPIWQLTRMAIPTILAGNVVLVKHSPNTQRSSLEFERVMLEAGFPEGVFQNLILKRDDIVKVINDPRVQGASVTGSVGAGSAVASEAGKVIKKTVMDLGAPTHLSSVKMRIFRRPLRPVLRGVSATQDRSAWLPNVSSWWRRSPTSSSICL